jgi:hypothetical protein
MHSCTVSWRIERQKHVDDLESLILEISEINRRSAEQHLLVGTVSTQVNEIACCSRGIGRP